MTFKKNEIYLTKEGLKRLQEELRVLQEEKHPSLVKRVARARDYGDLTENAEYANAREELAFLKTRIEELEGIIAQAAVIKSDKRKRTVALGSKVTVQGNGQRKIYTLVGEWEADPKLKKISYNSPLGKALMGKKVGEKVKIEAPAGKIIYTIKKIH